MEKFVIPVLVGTVVLLGGIVTYFLKGQNDKLDQIYLSTRSLPSMTFSIRDVRDFSEALREVTESYKELGIEPRVIELTLPKSGPQKSK